MRKILTIFLCAIFLALPVLADNAAKSESAKPASTISPPASAEPGSATELKLQQQKLDFFKENLESQDKRIGDLGVILGGVIGLFGILITGIVVFFSIRTVHAAKDEAEQVIGDWIDRKGKARLEKQLKPEIEAAIQKIHDAALPTIRELERELNIARERIQEIDKIIAENSARMEKPTQSQIENDEKAEKPDSNDPSKYSSEDWLKLGVKTYHDGKFEMAKDNFERSSASSTKPLVVATALLYKGITLGQMRENDAEISVYDDLVTRYGNDPDAELTKLVATALNNKGVRLGRLGRNDNAIEVYDNLVHRYGDVAEIGVREQVAMALYNKAVTLSQMGRDDDAFAAYDSIVQRYGNAVETSLREQVAMALYNMGNRLEKLGEYERAITAFNKVGKSEGDGQLGQLRMMARIKLEHIADERNRKGFTSLRKAKKFWEAGDEATAKSLLVHALADIELALACKPDRPIALGNQGYILFLLGRTEQAREILANAIQLGGDELRRAELADADIHPLPQDEAFKTLINSL